MIECLPMEFSVCRVRDYSGVDIERPFTFTGRTDRERSLVCPTSDVPSDVMDREDGWRALRVSGTLDFSLVGIISRIAGVLSAAGSLFSSFQPTTQTTSLSAPRHWTRPWPSSHTTVMR